MYYALSLFTGMLISVMVVFNGQLDDQAGRALSLVITQAAGLVFMLGYLLIKKEKVKFPRLPFYLYAGGFLSVSTILLNNLAFGQISVTAMMALALLGDSATGLAADHFGILGLPQRPFRAQKLWGVILIVAGIGVMLDSFATLAVLFSVGSGVLVMLTRLLNGELAKKTSLGSSTLVNYLAGITGALLLLLLLGSGPLTLQDVMGGPFYIYMGGFLGAIIVLLSSLCVGKIPSFYQSLVLFVGKILAGLLLDTLLSGSFSYSKLLGGLCVLGGLMLNLFIDKKAEGEA